jgi:hypothetical protein
MLVDLRKLKMGIFVVTTKLIQGPVKSHYFQQFLSI